MEPIYILIIVLSYFLILITISLITGKKADSEDFYIGGRKSPWFVVAFGMLGASLSGVTFISVPGWVMTSEFSYLQMVLGYILGYIFIAYVLLPVYYKLELTSIYTYLENRFGKATYKTGASFFLLSRTIGAAFRLFLVASVLQFTVFKHWNISFFVTVIVTILFIYIYTFKGGIRTIIWTDTLQTLFMLGAVIITIWLVFKNMDGSAAEIYRQIDTAGLNNTFNFFDWRAENHFIKQFLSGAFITIVMTGLDQDMMQKNLSCKNLKDAQKNMISYGTAFVPVNIIFLSLGALLIIFSSNMGISLPGKSDHLYPLIATGGYLHPIVGYLFILGLIAAAYSSADSAITALTTSVTIDILNMKDIPEKELKKRRFIIHFIISLIIFAIIMIFHQVQNENVISSLFKAAGYTYGPLLGLFSLGLFTNIQLKNKYVPLVCAITPVLSYLINLNSESWLNGYKFGFEILILNGFLTFMGLLIIRERNEATSIN